MILSWAMKYLTLSFNKGWGEDANAFFYNDFLKLSSSPLSIDKIIVSVLIGIAIIWLMNWFICYKGVKVGIEKMNKILLPCLLVIMIIIVIRGVTLEGAEVGLNRLFTPDWEKVKDPKVFTMMGIWGNILGILFFVCLVCAGITSAVSLVEAIAAAIMDKFGWAREKVVTGICAIGFLISTVFATNAGLYLLDIMDSFINNYGIVTVGLLEAFVIGWIIKPKEIREHTNRISYFKIGRWWDLIIKYVTPTLLVISLIQSLVTEFKAPYGGYDLIALFLYGWLVIALGIIGGLLISKKPWKIESKFDKKRGVNIND